MIKIWRVTFHDGEEYHLCGEHMDVCKAAAEWDVFGRFTVEYVRWMRG